MGEVYARYAMGMPNPSVGLLSNGEEDSKGNELTRETNALLRATSLNYSGYIEGRDIFSGHVDVVVCDGFVGNVVLKLSEGLADAAGRMLKKEILKSWISKLGYLFVRGAFNRFKKIVDYAEYGGCPLLGINGVGMICHGGSNVKAIKNAIRFAHEYARERRDRTCFGNAFGKCGRQHPAGRIEIPGCTVMEMSMLRSRITGTGSSLPEKILTNARPGADGRYQRRVDHDQYRHQAAAYRFGGPVHLDLCRRGITAGTGDGRRQGRRTRSDHSRNRYPRFSLSGNRLHRAARTRGGQRSRI